VFTRDITRLFITVLGLLALGSAGAKDPPLPTRSLGEMLAAQGYTAVPLTPTADGTMFLVRVNLDGHDFTLVVDTGAADAFNLTKSAGKKLGIRSDTEEFQNEPWSGSIPTKKFGRGAVREVRLGKDYTSTWNYSALALESLTASLRVRDSKTGKEEVVDSDGMLGQEFLLANSAVIDHDTATLYVIPLAKKDGPKLEGRWVCTAGERGGKPLDNLDERWIEFDGDGTKLHLDGETASGTRLLHRLGSSRILFVGTEEKGQATKSVARGIYDVSGDRLRLCVVDEPFTPKVFSWVGVTPPSKFEAKAKSGHVYYEFTRVKAERK
jgi:uncharacterized protein (TIGR03067 family)